MNVWHAVVICGAIGGAASTLLPWGMDIPWPKGIDGHVRSTNGCFKFFYHLTRNAGSGALAAFIVWAGNNPSSAFSDIHPNIITAGFAATIGLAGVAILNKLGSTEGYQDTKETIEKVKLPQIAELRRRLVSIRSRSQQAQGGGSDATQPKS